MSVFPSSWDPTSANKKRRKTFMEVTDQNAAASVPVEFQSDLQQTVLRKLTADYPPAVQSELSLDHVLGRVSYKTMLENLFGNIDQYTPDVPVLSRSYEESFMRQPMAGERPCVMGDQCECMFIDKSSPFIGVEFRLPKDPETPQMCVLCSRATTQKCFYDMCFLGRPVKGVIQRFGNIFGQPGEYSAECMLICPRSMALASMPVPCMSHQRNRYSVVQGAVKLLKQSRVIMQWGTRVCVHPVRLEGGQSDGSPLLYIPESPPLDSEVAELHAQARTGTIAPEHAEMQINTYLFAAAYLRRHPTFKSPRSLLLLLTDAPQPACVPDLGNVLHRVLSRDPFPCCLSALVEQCIPCFRHTTRTIKYEDSQGVILNLVLAFLLGLYQGAVKKPQFGTRVVLYAMVHTLLTSDFATQTAFCVAHEDVLTLACMEYLARIPPVYMPVQNQLLQEASPMAGFFKRIPPLCDDFRQMLEPGEQTSWQALQAACKAMVERGSRLKRCHRLAVAREPAVTLVPRHARAYWEVPVLHSATQEECRLVAASLALDGDTLYHIQRELQVFALPGNLRDAQIRALASSEHATPRAAYLRTRRYVCMNCMLSHRALPQEKLRLDTLSQELTCSSCLQGDLLCVDLLGRVMRFRKTTFYLCPSCVSVRQYDGHEQIWPTFTERCRHQSQARESHAKPKGECSVCGEPTQTPSLSRVDHLTGEMHAFYYCQRHMLRHETAAMCVNAAQLMRANAGGRSSFRG